MSEEREPNPDKFMATDMVLLNPGDDPRVKDYAAGWDDKNTNKPSATERTTDYYRGYNDCAKTHPKDRTRAKTPHFKKKVKVHVHRS